MPYRTNAIIDLAQIARDAPLGGAARRRRTRIGVLASLLAAAGIVALIGHLLAAGTKRRFVSHAREPLHAVGPPLSTEPPRAPSIVREVPEPPPCTFGECDPFTKDERVPFPGLSLVDVGKRHEEVSKTELRLAVSRHAAWIHECYRAARSRGAGLVGTVRVSFVDASSGAALPAALVSDDVTEPLLLACLARGLRGPRALRAVRHVAERGTRAPRRAVTASPRPCAGELDDSYHLSDE